MVFLDGLGHGSTDADQAPLLLEKALLQRLQMLTRQPRVYENLPKLIERIQQSDSKLSDYSARLLAERDSTNVSGGVTFAHDPRLKGFFFRLLFLLFFQIINLLLLVYL